MHVQFSIIIQKIFETTGWFLLMPTYIIFGIYSIIPTYVCSAPGILMALIISIFGEREMEVRFYEKTKNII